MPPADPSPPTSSSTAPSNPTGAIPRSPLWPSLLLAIVLMATKLYHRDGPWLDWGPSWLEYLSEALAITYADILFALALGLLGFAALRLTRRHIITWIAFLALCTLCVFYAVASVFIYQALRSPLTYALLNMAGDFGTMHSSIGAFVTAPRIVALIVIPLLYLGASLAAQRYLPPRRNKPLWIARLCGSLAILACVLAGRHFAAEFERWDNRRLTDNPHWAFISTTLAEWTGRSGPSLNEPFPPEYLSDFHTAAERAPSPTTQPSHRPKNVILIVLESTGSRYLSLYGAPYDTTPNLNAEAPNSLVFTSAYSHVQSTAHALVSLNLSIYPGLSWRPPTVGHPDLPGTSLAQALKAHGYRTAYLSAGGNEYANVSRFLTNRGFDDLWDYHNLGDGSAFYSWGTEDRILFDGMLNWIDRGKDPAQPFFLMAWTIQSHHPYALAPGQKPLTFTGPDTAAGGANLQAYLNTLHNADQQLGRLFAALRQRKLADDTLIVITGDHGESFGPPHNTTLHSGKVFQEDLAVPLIFWNPRLDHRGQRLSTPAGHIDINPTILDLLGFPSPGQWQGRSLLDPTRPPRVYLYGPTDHMLAVRQDNWKYVYTAARGTEALYDLSADPEEQHDLAPAHPDLCKQLRQRLSAWLSASKSATP